MKIKNLVLQVTLTTFQVLIRPPYWTAQTENISSITESSVGQHWRRTFCMTKYKQLLYKQKRVEREADAWS